MKGAGKAIFIDRDGTLIKSVHYLNQPEQVELFPAAANVLRCAADMGYLRIIVTNQAAIEKGLLSVPRLEEIQDHLSALLNAQGTAYDGWYYCPKTSPSGNREVIEHPDRKPGPGMLLKAARDHRIDLSNSVMVGDMISDTLAGRNAGCRATVLISQNAKDVQHPSVDYTIRDIAEFPDLIEMIERSDR